MKSKGFTLIELMVVIGVIGILAAVIIGSLNSTKNKARNTRRLQEIKSIHTALVAFHSQYGCLPTTSGSTCIGGYSEGNTGGWDYSSQGGFLTFLVSSGIASNVPVDPINNMTGDSTSGQYAYRYFCYTGLGVVLGYWTEPSWTYVPYLNVDPSFICM